MEEKKDTLIIADAALRLYEPASDFGSADLQLNNEQLMSIIEGIIGEIFTLPEMVRDLQKYGFIQLPAGNVLYWLLKRK